MTTIYHLAEQKKKKSFDMNEKKRKICWNDWVRLWTQFRSMNKQSKKKTSNMDSNITSSLIENSFTDGNLPNHVIDVRRTVHIWKIKLNIEWIDVCIFRSVTTWNISFRFENMLRIVDPLKLFLRWNVNDVDLSLMKGNRQSHIILANENCKIL